MTDQTRELKPNNNRRDIILFLLILVGGWYGFLRWTHHVPAEPNAIIRAMAPAPKDGPYYDEEDVIGAIRRFGNVNWHSPGEHPTSFLIGALGTPQTGGCDVADRKWRRAQPTWRAESARRLPRVAGLRVGECTAPQRRELERRQRLRDDRPRVGRAVRL